MIEIERKFSIKSEAFKLLAFAKHEIAQGYLNSNPERTVRIRIKGNKGYLTIKGKGTDSGMSRFEWEKEIDLEEAKAVLKLSEKGAISKTRYEVQIGKNIY
jgi:adenylate cyclase